MNTNNETIFCVWGARASRMLVAVSRRNELPCSILCHRFETRSFPISLVAYPRDFAFYVADPISSIHRSSRINWIRVDSCAFVVTTSLASRGEFGFREGRSAESPRVYFGGKRENPCRL